MTDQPVAGPGPTGGPEDAPAATPEDATTGTVAPAPDPGAAAEQIEAAAVAPPGSVVALPRPAVPARTPRRVVGYLAAGGGGLVVGAFLVAALALGVIAPGPSPTPAATPAPSLTPSVPSAWADGQVIGRPDAPVTVEIWADYQCPYCRLEAVAFGPTIEREYAVPGIARVVFRDFAILGEESVAAAVAARCAGRQAPGGYWRFHDLLFAAQQGENQGTFAPGNLVALAGIADLDVTAFSACLDDTAVRAEVTAETAAGRAIGVESTPTTIVTGPGGKQVLRGFSGQWSVLADAIETVTRPAASPSPGASATPGASPTASPTP